jgi:hypothetical protein
MASHLNISNAFAALEKGKKSKDKKDKKKLEKKVSTADLEKAIFSAPQMGITSWADEDDDDFSHPPIPESWSQVWDALRRAGGAGRAGAQPDRCHAGTGGQRRHRGASQRA